jgi:hypothetical protein
VTGLQDALPEFDSEQGQGRHFFPFVIAFKSAQGPIQPCIQRVSGPFPKSTVVGWDADHPQPFSAEVKNAWSRLHTA